MNKLLIASHIDLLVYDPLYLNNLANKNNDKLFIFLPNINHLENNKNVTKLINELNLNVLLIPNVESDNSFSRGLFFKLKDFIKKEEINLIYICNPTRLHCYICYLAASTFKKEISFLYYQGSAYHPKGERDDSIFGILKNFTWFLKTDKSIKIAKIILLLRKYIQIFKVIKISFQKIPINKIKYIKIIFNVLLNQGVPIDGIVAHDRIGLNGMLYDVPAWHNKNLKLNSILLSKKDNQNTIKKILYDEIYLLPSLMFNKSFSHYETLLALDTYIELNDFIKLNYPNIKIHIKPRPRSSGLYDDKILKILKEKKINIVPRNLTLNQFLHNKSLLITDVSSSLNYCHLNNIRAISYQTKATCAHFYYYNELPIYFNESMFIIDRKESIINFLE